MFSRLFTMPARRRKYTVLLFVLLGAAFAIPVVFAVNLSGVFKSSDATNLTHEDLFPAAVTIQKRGAYLRISNSKQLSPEKNKDFLLTGWFNLKRLPREGEKVFLLSKFDIDTSSLSGYAIALLRSGGSVKPAVYWRDVQGRGGWYNFAGFDLKPREWFLLGLSFYNGKFLGLHILIRGRERKIQLLGGYDLEYEIIPQSSANMIGGSLGSGLFRGKIGPVCIFSKEGLAKHLKEVLKDIAASPLDVPDFFESSEVKLCLFDGKHDASQYGHSVVHVKAKLVENVMKAGKKR